MILVLGAKGMLGGQLMKVFDSSAIGWDRNDIEVTDFNKLKSKILNLKSVAAIINCVAYNDVDGAEKNLDLAFKLNAEVPKHLAQIAASCNSVLVHFSTNYVFDGKRGEYEEGDTPNPLSVYAESKYEGEQAVQNSGADFFLIRTAVLFGPKGQSELSKKSFVDLMLELGQSSKVKAVADETNSVTYAVDLAEQIKLLLNQPKPYGVYHIVNSGQASWYEFAREIFKIRGMKVDVQPVHASDFQRPAQRPQKAVLINTKLPSMRSWRAALSEFLKPNT
jgi:dTDP-4-dehydrorhamnose reductase